MKHLRVTSGHLRSRDVISCLVTDSSCELKPCMKANAQNPPVFDLLQPLPGELRSNDVTSESLPVTWGHVTSFPVTWRPPPARYSLVGSQMHSIWQFSDLYSHFLVISNQISPLPGHFRSPEVTWRHFLSHDASSCEQPPCRKSNAEYLPVFSLVQPLPCNFRSNDVTSGHLRSSDVISCHVTTCCELQSCRKSNAQYTPVF